MLSRKHLFTVFFLTSITGMMLTVAEPRQNPPVDTNTHFERDKPAKNEKEKPPAFVDNGTSLKPTHLQVNRFWIHLARKQKERFRNVG